MKKIIVNKVLSAFILILLTNIMTKAQVPEGIPYQAVARDAAGIPLSNHIVNVRFSILDSVATGSSVYTETHTTNTNNLGSFTVNLGKGTPVLNSFTSINWGLNSKFLKVEIDTSSGLNYIEVGTQQMMSVPYALYAFNASFSANGVPVGDQGEICISCWGKPVWSSNGLCPQINSTCGASNVLSSILNYGNLTDIDGNNYKTIKIGSQTWMAENLKVSHYSNGDSIPTINTLSYPGPNLTYGARGWPYNDSATYNCPYGALYNLNAQINSNNVCPVGWHVSTKNDWDTLINFIGVKPAKKLKSIGSQYWHTEGAFDESDLIGGGGSNKYGLSILPAGNGFNAVGEQANYFGIDSGNNPLLISFSLGDNIWTDSFLCGNCFYPIRCVKD